MHLSKYKSAWFIHFNNGFYVFLQLNYFLFLLLNATYNDVMIYRIMADYVLNNSHRPVVEHKKKNDAYLWYNILLFFSVAVDSECLR